MQDDLVEALETLSHDASGELAEQFREATLQRIRGADQGADGMEEYVTEVREGSAEGEYFFEIQHPTAPLHERGGHIEPTYARAMTFGWTRDGFYEALTDCNELVRRKKIVRRAADDLKRN